MPQQLKHRESIRLGALYMLASGLMFAAMGALIKLVSVHLPSEMVVFFRSAMGLLVLLPWLWHRGLHQLCTHRLAGHLLRAFAGLAAMYCYFYSVAHLPLAEAALLNYSTPLFVPFMALLWLHEPVPRRVAWAIITGFAGILFILKPGLAMFTPVSLIGLAAGLFGALAMVGIRRLTRTEPAARIVFYFTAVSAAVSAVPLLWTWRTPPPELWALLVTMGLVASLGQMFLTRAYAHAPAAQVGPFTYATVVFAAIAGWVFWGELPDIYSFLGAGLVVAGGVLAIRRAGRMAAPGALAARGS